MICVDRLRRSTPTAEWRWEFASRLFDDCADVEALHAFAQKAGISREWYDGSGLPSYNLTSWMRRRALQAGAQPVEDIVLVSAIRSWAGCCQTCGRRECHCRGRRA